MQFSYLPLLLLPASRALAEVADIAIAARAQITAAPYLAPALLEKRQNLQACASASALLDICESGISNFDNLPATRQASCLCYSSSSWIPNLFDGYINSCATAASSAGLRTAYSAASSFSSLCARAGNVRTAAASSGGVYANEPACSTLNSYLNICKSLTPGFVNADISTQARCLCYSSATWKPTVVDNLITSCAAQASSAGDLSYYSVVTPLRGFCASAGDVTSAGGSRATGANSGVTGLATNTRAGIVPATGDSTSTPTTSARVVTITPSGAAAAATFMPAAQYAVAAGAAAVMGML